MGGTGLRHETDLDAKIGRLAAESAPAQTDFADRIMRLIEAERQGLIGGAGQRRRGRSPAALAGILACVLLLSGFAYSAAVEGWLTVRDKDGGIAMEIRQETAKAPAGYDRIRSELHERLKPGETAAFVIGTDAIARVMRGEMPKAVYEVAGMTAFSGWEEASRHVPGPLAGIRMPETVDGLALGRVELAAESWLSLGKPLPKGREWKRMTEQETGIEYAFLILPASSMTRHALFVYERDKEKVVVKVTFAQGRSVQVIHDNLPSSRRVAWIGDTPVYQGDPAGLTWPKRIPDGLLSYQALSASGDADRELAAARAVIAAEASAP